MWLALSVGIVSAQDGRALRLTIAYDGVQVRRANTDAWLTLPRGAVMPIGTGDAVRTDATGRAMLAPVDDSGALLLLPNAQLTVTGATVDGFTLTMDGGELVLRTDAPLMPYTLHTADLTVMIDEAAHVLVSRTTTAGYALNAEGMTTVLLPDDDAQALPEQRAAYQFDDGLQGITSDLTAPITPAQVEGRLLGCAGQITTASGENLNARTGPGTLNLQLGQFPNIADVQVMGLIESGTWYRVQFRGGFGWVERLAATLGDTDCVLPSLPDSAYDLPNRVFNIGEDELALLLPFYGTPDADPIFYRTD